MKLRVTSPLRDALVKEATIRVTGFTRPDATVSVNGILAVPDTQGKFTVDLQVADEANPISIEVIASSVNGESSSIVLTQIFTGTSSQPRSEGLFGTISSISGDHPRAVAGETDIVLSTNEGSVELTATTATAVRIPGLASPLVDSLLEGDQVAALVSQDRVISILVQGTQPLKTAHFTGIVTSIHSESGMITLQKPGGESIRAAWIARPTGLVPGALVTAVMEQGLASGRLVITGLDAAQASLERLAAAMGDAEKGGSSSRFEELKQRLISNSAAQLTLLEEASEKLGPAMQVPVLQQLASSIESNRALLVRFDAGGPQSNVTGIVTSIDLNLQVIVVEPRDLKPVEVFIPGDASFWRAPGGLPSAIAESWLRGEGATQSYANQFGGRESRFQQLDLANRVKLRYGLDTGEANRILVLPAESLDSSKTDVLLDLAARGAAMGTVTDIDGDSQPPTLKIRDEISGRILNLSVSPGSELLEGSDPIALSALTGSSVDASYRPSDMSIIKLNALAADDQRDRVHGVVHSLVPKIAPGNFVILTDDEVLRTFDHTRDTVIIRDGRRVTISQVHIGDLVQPDTYYLPGDGTGDNLDVLSLKSPQSARVQGTIRGVSKVSRTTITVTNNWLELINIEVDENTKISLEGTQLTANGLAVGQRVLAGDFDPISGLAQILLIGPP